MSYSSLFILPENCKVYSSKVKKTKFTPRKNLKQLATKTADLQKTDDLFRKKNTRNLKIIGDMFYLNKT